MLGNAFDQSVLQEEMKTNFEFELVYTVYEILDAEAYEELAKVFFKANPDVAGKSLDPSSKEQQQYYGFYRDELFETVAARLGPQAKQPGKSFRELQPQILREQRVRFMFEHMLAEARATGSLKAVFARMAKAEASLRGKAAGVARKICSTESENGLLVYRHLRVSFDELSRLSDRGERIGIGLRRSIVTPHSILSDPSAFPPKAYLLTDRVRAIHRVVRAWTERDPMKGTE